MTSKSKSIGYGDVVSPDGGQVVAVETAAGRSAKASLIVHHAALEAPAHILHEHSAKFQALWLSPSGSLHAASNDGFHHTNASGKWTKTRVVAKGDALLSMGGVGDNHLLASSYSGRLFERVGTGDWQEVFIDGAKPAKNWFSSFTSTGPADVYAVASDAAVHFDGTSWRRIPSTDAYPKSIAAASPDEVYIASGLGLYRGNAREGFRLVATEKLQHVAVYQGVVFTAGYSSGIFRWDGSALVPSGAPEMSVTCLNAGSLLCATGMDDCIHVYDGKHWSTLQS